MSEADQNFTAPGNSKPIGRRGWFKQAGVAAAGLTLGSKLDGGTQSDVVKASGPSSSPAGQMNRPAKPIRGINCGFDEGPI